MTVAELSPYISRVRTRVIKNAENPTWSILKERWEKVLVAAERRLESINQGITHNRYERLALSELIKLKPVPPERIMETALALYLLASDQPRRFQSDHAFDFQLVRRVRTLTDSNAGQYWDNTNKKSKRVYRDIAPKTMRLLAAYLKETFALAGLVVANLETEEIQRAEAEREQLKNALGTLK